jgi:EAL domain-containing protein (putative c-di-GMP-specific phosphodiesterase class I)
MIGAQDAVTPGNLNGPLAYVLDDRHEVGEVVCRMLMASGFAARQFSDPGPCLQQVKAATPTARPEVLILDLALGQSDAVEVIRQLEKLEYKGKVLLMSGSDVSMLLDIQRIGAARGLAMLPPLKKPFRMKELKESLFAKAELRQAPPEKKLVEAPTVPLAKALASNWLELWYQPKIDLKSLSICGAEALLRARHPIHGVIAPQSFLPPAGDPLFSPLSKLVARQAMTDWMHHFAGSRTPLRLAINVPLSVIVAPGFVELLRQSLPQDASFPGLIIEVTEGEALVDVKLAQEVATQLKLYRIWLSIDDFGAAYSSFARLRDLPFIELKLDRSFVLHCSSDPSKKALCHSAIDLAHRFGASACAEGVDNPHDLRTLIEMGCDTAQGFLFAKPQSAKIFEAMLAGPAA